MDRSGSKEQDLIQIISHDKVNATPSLKDLYQHITPQYAADWKVIGTLLGLPSGELKAIEAGYPTNVKWCCNQMLEKWLEMDPTASWGKLFTIINSPAVSGSQVADKGVDAISKLSEIVSQYNVQEWFSNQEETWPPNQPKNFTPLVLIHHQGQHSLKEATTMARLLQTGDIDEISSLASTQSVPKHYPKLSNYEPSQEVLNNSTVTKELTEILSPLEQSETPQFILIEGAPGIGKSILLKEIAYRWGNKHLLKTFKLVFLLCLRDPAIQQLSSLSNLLQHFCEGSQRAVDITAACHDYLTENGGKNLVFLFDGFDEFPIKFYKDSIISKIINRKLLHACGIVVSSRPYASVHLREQATVRVSILGFTEKEQKHFIQQTLKEQPQGIKELTQYLDDHFTISSLCVVPFNMVVLLFLYKQGISFPNNSTQLYNHFICLTICQHLAKYGYPLDNTITDLTNLPDPCAKVIQQLSKLSFEALKDNKLVFTFDEIKQACPDITNIPGAINGFGLLQAVQHFGLTGKTMTFNFLHFTIQEFLAAHYVASLSPSLELKILKEKFWDDIYFDMFAIYVALTKGQHPSFKQFLKPSILERFKGFLFGENVTISNQFLGDSLKCLRLFRCFFEAGDKDVCTLIENAKIFNDRELDLHYTTLSPSDIECITTFLTYSSHKQWKELNLTSCFIQDHGVKILHRGLTRCDVTIRRLGLSWNGLTESSSAAISDLTISCKTKVLRVNGNVAVCEDNKLYRTLSDPASMMEEFYLAINNLSCSSTIKLFSILSESNKLKILAVTNNNITDEACGAIIMAMKRNNSLVGLSIKANPISGDQAQLIIQALQYNNTLQWLQLPNYHRGVKDKIRILVEGVNKNREAEVKLKVHCGSMVIAS